MEEDKKIEELLIEVEKHFGLGCAKICRERHEQINKHGRTVEKDVEIHDTGQLINAAQLLLTPTTTFLKDFPPRNWDGNIWAKMCNKEYFEDRIVISATLTAAEIDRLNSEINEIFN